MQIENLKDGYTLQPFLRFVVLSLFLDRDCVREADNYISSNHELYSRSSGDFVQQMLKHNNGLKYSFDEVCLIFNLFIILIPWNLSVEAILSKIERKFQYVVIINGIDGEHQECFEDAMKRLYGK